VTVFRGNGVIHRGHKPIQGDVCFRGLVFRIQKEVYRTCSLRSIRSPKVQEAETSSPGKLGKEAGRGNAKEMLRQGEAAHMTQPPHDPARTIGRVRGQTLRSPDRGGRSGARRAGVELIAGGGEGAQSTGLLAGMCRLLQRGARQPRRPGLCALQLLLMCDHSSPCISSVRHVFGECPCSL